MGQSHHSRSGIRRQAQRSPHSHRQLHVEHLEDRRLLALVTVNTELDTFDPDDGVTSLREAIFATNIVPGPDDIVFDFGHDGPATILLEEGELEITEALTITGDGPELLTIDAQQQSRIFNITAETGGFTIAGMTLTGGRRTGDGGAIRSLTTGNLAIQDSDVSDNSTTGRRTDGGGVFAAGDVTVTSSTISGNSAEEGGGGIFGRNVTVASSTISGNSADRHGGGIGATHRVTVTSTTISENSAEGGGGVSSRGDVTVTSSTISDNTAYHGGGINTKYAVTVTSSTISGNSAGIGGGISAYGGDFSAGGAVTVTSSTISGNSAEEKGGGIAGGGGGVTVTNSTVSDNSAEYGGGIWTLNDVVRIKSSIVAGNSDDGIARDLLGRAGAVIVEHSFIGDNTGTGLTEAPVGTPDAKGNLIGGPTGGIIDPLLNALTNNGGPTRTHALLPGSPAVDAGDPLAMAGVGEISEFDQRGTPYTRVSGGRIDMGAHERQNLTVEILDVVSPTITPVDEVTIQFSGEASGFDIGDLQLSLNGRENLLTGSQTLSSSDNQTFVLGGLADVTTASAYYTLELISSGSGIVDANDGGPLDSGASMSWAVGRSELGLTVDTLVDESDGSIDDGDISIRDAIAAAAPGETIGFDASLSGGTIVLTLGEMPLIRSLIIDASALATGLVIDASGNDPTPDVSDGKGSRVFDINDQSSFVHSPVTIRGLTLTGGDVADGGGAIRTVEPLTITSTEISGNSADDDGGGVQAFGDVVVTSSTISGNSANWRGGGIQGHSVTVTGSTVSKNSATYGGGIQGHIVTVTSSTISANSADGDYGGGGGIDGYAVTVISSTISGNAAGRFGGGIDGRTVTVISSTISGNAAGRFGGGIDGRTVTVNSSTISGNAASGEGGGIWTRDDPVTIKNSIVAGNTDDGTAPDFRLFTGTLTVENSLLGDATGTDLTEAPVSSSDANGNLIGGPVNGIIDPMLAPLANNGKPTPTHRLLPGSPAIDAGDPTLILGDGTTPDYDQRGSPFNRVYDGDGIDGARIDMGAFELQPQPGDLNGDLAVNFADLTPFALALTDPDAYEAMYSDLDRVFLCDVSGDGLCNFGDLQPFADLLVGGEVAEGDNLESGAVLAIVPTDLMSDVSRPSQHTAFQVTSGVVDPADLRDLALIAWLSSLSDNDADGGTESRPAGTEAEHAVDLPTSVVESVFQGMGA